MSDLIISLFNDDSLMDISIGNFSLMELVPQIYGIEYKGKRYEIDDEYWYRNQGNANEINIKLLVYDDEVHLDRSDF